MTAAEMEGMPTREGDLSIEAHGMEPIPTSARYGSVGRLFTVWFTPNLTPAAFFIGTLVTLDFLKLGFVTSILAILVGNLLGAVFVGILSTMGPKTGMAQLPVGRLPFGKSIVLPGLLNWLSMIGWDGINNLFGAVAFTLIFPAVPFGVALILIVVAQAAVGIVGYEAIHQLEKWGAVVLGILFVVLSLTILGQADTSLSDGFSGADQIGAFVAYVAIVASFVFTWSLYASDYSRYLPEGTSSPAIARNVILGTVLSTAWLEILGLLVATKATGGQTSDTIFALLGGSGNIIAGLAMVAIVLGTVAVNCLNDYTGSLSLQAAGLRVKRIYSAAIVAALGFVWTLYLKSSNFTADFTNFLLFLSYWIAPYVGIVLADWLLRGRRADVSRLSDFAKLPSGVLALAALAAGFIVGIPFQNSSLGYAWGGPFNWVTANYLHGADLAYYVGGSVAFLIYWIARRGELRPAR
jgi:NCS1 family nucleobase:cation symporter-1